MKRTTFLSLVLLPLSVWAAAPSAKTDADQAATNSPHAWPALATATSPTPVAPAFSLVPPDALTDRAVRSLREIDRSPSPAVSIPSLAHVDLRSDLRLALVCRPQVTTNMLGASTSRVSLLSLQW